MEAHEHLSSSDQVNGFGQNKENLKGSLRSGGGCVDGFKGFMGEVEVRYLEGYAIVFLSQDYGYYLKG